MGRRASPLPRGASGRRTRRGEAAGRRVSVEPELGGSKGDGAARVSRGGGGTGSRGFGEGARCFYRGEDRASACEPKAAQRRAPGRVGLGGVLPKHTEEKALTGGSRASATEGGRAWGLADWAKKKERAGEENWAAGKEEEKEGWAGLG